MFMLVFVKYVWRVVCMVFLFLCRSSFTALICLECVIFFSFLSAEKRRHIWVQTVQVTFSNAYMLL